MKVQEIQTLSNNVLDLITQRGPISIGTIAVLTNSNKTAIWKKVQSLSKRGLIKPSTSRTVTFWKVKK